MVVLSKEAKSLKSLTANEKYQVLCALHGSYEIKNLGELGVSAQDRGTLPLVGLMKKYPIFDSKFIIAICAAVESFTDEQLQDAQKDYEAKFGLDEGHEFLKTLTTQKGK
jgi:hypothetical protein